MSNIKCFIHSFIHSFISFFFFFLIYNTVDIFVFISTVHLLFHAKQKYRSKELSYCYDHNARNWDSNSPYWCIDVKHRKGVWDFPLDRRQLPGLRNFQVSWLCSWHDYAKYHMFNTLNLKNVFHYHKWGTKTPFFSSCLHDLTHW